MINNLFQINRLNTALKSNSFFTPLAVTLLLSTMFILMNLNGWHKNLSFDEPHNLSYGHNILAKGPLTDVDGQRTPIFTLHALACASYKCSYNETINHPWRLFWIRLPSMLFTLALGFLIWLWSADLYGRKAAFCALLIYALNPNFIAHGKEVTSDTITSFWVVLSLFLFWKWQTGQKVKHLLLTAIAVGIAIVTKLSAILLLGILPLIFITHQALKKNMRFKFTAAAKLMGQFMVALLLIWLIINLAYLFQGSFESTRSQSWKSSFYKTIAEKTDFPIPLPRIFVRILDYSHYISEHPELGRGNNYILGHRHRKGRDYAFAIMLLLKTPLALFLLILVAIKNRTEEKFTCKEKDISWIYLWMPFAVWFVFFSSFCDIQVGIRYILPAYAFLIIIASKAFESINSKLKLCFTSTALFWYVASSLSYHPHYMSYFNELIGDRINAYKYLADSNLDWEDKSYYIKKWGDNHPQIKYQTHPAAMKDPQPGFFLMPANYYVGVFDADEYKWLRNFKPLMHITYSHYLFYIGQEELEKALKNNSER